jgi:hypothetical protein
MLPRKTLDARNRTAPSPADAGPCAREIADFRQAWRRLRPLLAQPVPELPPPGAPRLISHGRPAEGPAEPRAYVIRRPGMRYGAEVHYQGKRYSCRTHATRAEASRAAAAKLAELTGGAS